jgi:hypothetical protein
MFTDKVVPISVNYPFFFKPIQDGMDRPKTELAYRVPASKLTRRKLESNEQLRELDGLDTTIDWKNTGDNSYDGEKLKLLAHDESGKWERPDNILNNWRVTKTTLRLGSRIVGKCMKVETILKNYTTIQMLLKEIETDKHLLDSIACSFLWSGTMKDSSIFMDYLSSLEVKIQSKELTVLKLQQELLNIGKTKLKD